MSERRYDDLFSRNAHLEERMKEASPQEMLDGLARSGKRNRFLIYVSYFLVLLDILGSLVLGVVVFETIHLLHETHTLAVAAQQAADARATLDEVLYQNCLEGNDFRIHDFKRWSVVLALSAKNPPSGQTAADRARQAQTTKTFFADLVKTDAPRDCSKLPGAPKKGRSP